MFLDYIYLYISNSLYLTYRWWYDIWVDVFHLFLPKRQVDTVWLKVKGSMPAGQSMSLEFPLETRQKMGEIGVSRWV